MAIVKGNSPRRREVRRSLSRPTGHRGLWWRQPEVVWPVVFALAFTLVAGMVTLWARAQPRYAVDQVVSQPIVARVEFTALDQERTQQRRELAAARVPPVYTPNDTYLSQIQNKLEHLGRLAADEAAVTFDKLPHDTVQSLQLTPEAFASARELVRDKSPAGWKELSDQFINRLRFFALLSPQQFDTETNLDRNPAQKITIRQGEDAVQTRHSMELFSTRGDNANLRAELYGVSAEVFGRSALADAATKLVTSSLAPTIALDEERTRLLREQERRSPEHDVRTTYQPNDLLIRAGRQLTRLDLELLAEERAHYRDALGAVHTWLVLPARMLVVGLVAAALWIYCCLYYPRIPRNPMRGLAITAVMIFAQLAAVGLTLWQPSLTTVTINFPALVAVMIFSIAYDRRLALTIGAMLTLLLVVSLDLPPAAALVTLTGVTASAIQLREVRYRSKLVMTGLWTGIAMSITAAATGLAFGPLQLADQISRIASDTIAAFLTGVAAGMVVQVVLPGVERGFKVTTALTLKDLNDASNPLLQRLVQEAPGTYQHSLRIADMAEAAAEAVGADGLLCRVGAMYHDIGKTNKPQYFVENQGEGPNRHAKLSPAMSLLIIVGHVKDGIEMAREYGLPRDVRHFIESHHGTTLVEYFFHAARQQRDAEGREAPEEFEFRYPGPKPQTREAAILMLCDGVEGAARAMSEPTPMRLEQLTHTMANKRLMDGQFDQCPLTLRDLSRVEAAITKTLCAVYHTRNKDPDAKKKEPASQTGPRARSA